MPTAKKITNAKVGQSVYYISSKGYKKLALVTAIPETVEPGHELPELPEGFVHLQVIPASGHHYPRFSVPSPEAAKNLPDYDPSNNVWVPID